MKLSTNLGLIGLCTLHVACSDLTLPELSTADAVSTQDTSVQLASSSSELQQLVLTSAVSGSSLGGLELRLVDAPLDAESVDVTFCGVAVKAKSVADDDENGEDSDLEPEGEEKSPTTNESFDKETGGDSDEEPEAEAHGAGEVEESEAKQKSALEEKGSLNAEEHDEGRVEATEDARSDEKENEGGDDSGGEESGEGAEASEDEDSDEKVDGSVRGGNWISLGDECRSVDLLDLQGGIFEPLGFAALPAGLYGQVRLMLTEASVVVAGERHALEIPSSAHSGLKIVGGFDLVPGEVTTVTIDFDAERSVHLTGAGQYLMRPVIFLADTQRHRAGETRQAPGIQDSDQDLEFAPDLNERPGVLEEGNSTMETRPVRTDRPSAREHEGMADDSALPDEPRDAEERAKEEHPRPSPRATSEVDTNRDEAFPAPLREERQEDPKRTERLVEN